MRIVFMGTPDFAVPSLKALVDAGHEVPLVLTQPDRPKGRGNRIAYSEVKEAALALNLPLYQPQNLKDEESAERIGKEKPDVIAVAAFGQLLPKQILDIPRLCCVNVHASLLPKYRGASPIQWTVLNGDKEGGVTIQKMAEGLDTGDILSQRSLELATDETAGSLFEKLSVLGASLLTETLELLEQGKIVPRPQDEALATKTGRIDKSFGRIDWEQSAVELERFIRAMDPWPGSYTFLQGRMFKLKAAEPVPTETKGAPGTVLSADERGILIAAGDGALLLKTVQLEGKKAMDAAEFLRGHAVRVGEVLKTT